MVKNNPQEFWSSTLPHQSNTFVLSETPTSEPQVIANAFNEYLMSVFTLDNHEISSCSAYYASLVSIDDVSVSIGVLNLILNVDPKIHLAQTMLTFSPSLFFMDRPIPVSHFLKITVNINCTIIMEKCTSASSRQIR